MPDTAMPDVASPEINQDNYVDDFSGNDINSEYLKKHAFIEENSSEADNNTTVNPEKKPAAAQAARPEASATEQPEKKVQPSNIDDLLYTKDEAGNKVFNRDSVIEFLNKDFGLKVNPAPVATAQQQQALPTQSAQPEVPAWKKAYDDQKAYEESIRQPIRKPFELVRQYMAAGNDFETSYNAAMQAMEQDLAQHFEEKRAEAEYNRQQEARKAETEERQFNELRIIANTNEANVMAQVGNPNVFKELFFNPNYGGTFVWKQFANSNPEAKSLQGADLQKAYDKFWVYFASDPENLAMVHEVARAKVALKNLPELLKNAGAQKEEQIKKQQAAAVIRPSGLVRQQKQEPNSTTKAVAEYFGVESMDELG